MDAASGEIPDTVQKTAARLGEHEDPGQAIAEADAGEVPSAWRAVLASFFEPEPTHSHALRVADRLRGLGWFDEAIPGGLARLVDAAGVPPSWTEWEAIDDRDELLLRLRTVSRIDAFDESMAPFVAFFFRASDRELYQAAAVAAGRHIDESKELREQVQAWARKRGRDLEGPVRLDGTRSSRRLLLLLVSERAARGDPGLDVLPDELVEEARDRTEPGPVAEAPAPRSDLAVLLSACRVLASHAGSREPVAPVARGLLYHVAALDRTGFDRAVVERWALLLVDLVAEPTVVDPATVADAWWAFVEGRLAAEGSRSAGFGATMTELVCLDEAVRGAAQGTTPLRAEAEERIGQAAAGEERALLRQRLAAWSRRRGIDPSGVVATLPDAGDLAEPLASAVALAGDETGSSLLGPPGRRRLQSFVDVMLQRLTDRSAWMAQDVGTRALGAMLLLDAVRHADLDQGQTAALLDRYGFADPTPEGAREVPETDRPDGVLAVAALLRLLRWEGDGAEAFLDPVAIARFGDVRLLEALLVGRREEALLVHLADSLEHQIRWQLRRREGFDLDRYLYRLTVCDPDPSFFDHLAKVAQGRTYVDAHGEEVPLASRLRAVARDQHAGGDEVPYLGPLGDGVRRARESLAAIGDEPDLRAGLDRLTDLLGDASGRGPAPGTLLWVMDQVRRGDEPLIRSAPPTWSEDSFQDLCDLADRVQRVETLARGLLPERWSDVDEVDDALTGIRAILDEVRARFPGPLPRVEADRFEAVLVEIEEDLSTWEDRVQLIAEEREHVETSEEWVGLLETATATWPDPVREQVLVGLWREAGDEGPASELVDRVLETDLVDIWHGAGMDSLVGEIAATWRREVEQVIEAGDEAGALVLLTAERYEPLRRREPGLHGPARSWCLDRLHPLWAARVERAFDPSRSRAGATVRAVGGFLAAFAPVWLAIAVGAILMFDFGDPWTALAETGDWQGIGITFSVGVVGTFLYVVTDLHRKVESGDQRWRRAASIAARASGFVAVCLVYTILVVGLLWWMFAGTGEVVTGPGAIGHVLVWTGFAIFVGIFFGLIAQST